MMNRMLWTLSLAGCLFATACKEAPVGSKERPFTMYFVPSVEAEGIALSAEKITQFVEKRVSEKLYKGQQSFHVKSAIPTSYIAVVEAFGTNKADFAALTSFSYILAREIKKYDCQAVLSVIRGDNERTYKGQIIVHADSPIQKLEDLQGKKFGFTDPASTSGFILPSKLFRDMGIELGETVFAGKHDSVVMMVYQKQVDAGATYYSPPKIVVEDGTTRTLIRDAREKVKTQYPDVEDKVRILAFTQDIPNDPWVMRNHILSDPVEDARLREAVVESLLEYAADPVGRKALEELYSVTGLVRANDATYEPLRQALGGANIDLEALLTKKK